MAHLKWYGKIVQVWRKPDSEFRFHVTETGRVLRTTGPKLGGAKLLRISSGYNLQVGKYATWNDDVKKYIEGLGYAPESSLGHPQ